ncbi:hypothetical protein AVEN_54068-1 [Araneus ventricosus]|uniref:Uncharacterized protein n=1 Tax=Araneus ventricosus TaxID=182803 RepID=A0A4Y2S286_ARAVE|nr:hypothetical protein AVEN_54068-1 [Araneus ventricosus]
MQRALNGRLREQRVPLSNILRDGSLMCSGREFNIELDDMPPPYRTVDCINGTAPPMPSQRFLPARVEASDLQYYTESLMPHTPSESLCSAMAMLVKTSPIELVARWSGGSSAAPSLQAPPVIRRDI